MKHILSAIAAVLPLAIASPVFAQTDTQILAAQYTAVILCNSTGNRTTDDQLYDNIIARSKRLSIPPEYYFNEDIRQLADYWIRTYSCSRFKRSDYGV